jgi:hypothetical protein
MATNKTQKPTKTRKPKCSAGCWKPAFLRTLAKHGNITAAADAAGISRRAAYDLREKDPEFKTQWDEAIERALDKLEEEAFKRATSTSDVLLIFLLKARRPEVYRQPSKVELSGVTASVNVNAEQEAFQVERGREQLLQIISLLQKRMREEQEAAEANGVLHPEAELADSDGQPDVTVT